MAQEAGDRTKGTNTVFFIDKSEVPHEYARETNGKFVYNVRPKKEEKNRTRLTVGRNRINYPNKVSIPTAGMLLVNILFISVISTKGAKFMTGDHKNFYLMTPLKQ